MSVWGGDDFERAMHEGRVQKQYGMQQMVGGMLYVHGKDAMPKLLSAKTAPQTTETIFSRRTFIS